MSPAPASRVERAVPVPVHVPVRPWRRAGLALTSLLVAVALTGCGSETDRYCDRLAADKETLDELAERATTSQEDVLGETLEVFEGLHDAAPGDLRDEWLVLESAWGSLEKAFSDAGVTPSEFDPENPPEGLGAEDLRRLTGAAEELRSQRVVEAGEGIEQHATDVCGVGLGLDG